jgi:hypothetical protein
MALDFVTRQSKEFHTPLFKLMLVNGNPPQFSRTNWGEVGWVRKKHAPPPKYAINKQKN